jgi:hypothetical protein
MLPEDQLVTALKVVTNKDLPVTHHFPRQGEIKYSYGDARKAEELGFKFSVGLIKGLNIMYHSLQRQINPQEVLRFYLLFWSPLSSNYCISYR